MSNKYQFADVISNEDSVLDVYVIDNLIQIVYELNEEAHNMQWINDFLERHDYEYHCTDQHGNGKQTDTYFTGELNESDSISG